MWNICIENFDAGKQEQATRLLHCSGNHMCVNTLSWLMKLKKKKERRKKQFCGTFTVKPNPHFQN